MTTSEFRAGALWQWLVTEVGETRARELIETVGTIGLDGDDAESIRWLREHVAADILKGNVVPIESARRRRGRESS